VYWSSLEKNFSAELSHEEERPALVLAAGAPLLPGSAVSQGSALPPPADADPSGVVENETLPPSPKRMGSPGDAAALALERAVVVGRGTGEEAGCLERWPARRRPARIVRRGEDAATRSGKGCVSRPADAQEPSPRRRKPNWRVTGPEWVQ